MRKKIKIKNEKTIFTIFIVVLLILSFLYYHFIFYNIYAKNTFANDAVNIAEQNENPIFTVQRVLLYSSATAIDKTKEQSLENISISQFSDIAIYIDNTSTISELTNENTIKELYIDNINITSNVENGERFINYKNPLDFGEYKELNKTDRIDFNIINTNAENENSNYSDPTFYTDCSNPISLGYMNKDLLKNYSVSPDKKTVSFNGKVLQEANINLDDLKCSISFRINIINNLNQKFVHTMSIDLDLNDDNGGIYNGYIYKGKTLNGVENSFFKEI